MLNYFGIAFHMDKLNNHCGKNDNFLWMLIIWSMWYILLVIEYNDYSRFKIVIHLRKEKRTCLKLDTLIRYSL